MTIPPFPKKHGEVHPVYHQTEIDEWLAKTIKALKEIKNLVDQMTSVEDKVKVLYDNLKEILEALTCNM